MIIYDANSSSMVLGRCGAMPRIGGRRVSRAGMRIFIVSCVVAVGHVPSTLSPASPCFLESASFRRREWLSLRDSAEGGSAPFHINISIRIPCP